MQWKNNRMYHKKNISKVNYQKKKGRTRMLKISANSRFVSFKELKTKT